MLPLYKGLAHCPRVQAEQGAMPTHLQQALYRLYSLQYTAHCPRVQAEQGAMPAHLQQTIYNIKALQYTAHCPRVQAEQGAMPTHLQQALMCFKFVFKHLGECGTGNKAKSLIKVTGFKKGRISSASLDSSSNLVYEWLQAHLLLLFLHTPAGSERRHFHL